MCNLINTHTHTEEGANRVGGGIGVGGGNGGGNGVGGRNGNVHGHGGGDGSGAGTGTGVEVNEGAQDGNGDGRGDGAGTGTGMETHRRTPDGNGDGNGNGNGDGSEDSSGDGNGARIKVTGTKIGSGRAEERRRSAINRKIVVDAKWETGETWVERKKKCRKERIGPVAANSDNLESHKEAEGRAQGTLDSSRNFTGRESVSPLSRLIRGFRNKYH